MAPALNEDFILTVDWKDRVENELLLALHGLLRRFSGVKLSPIAALAVNKKELLRYLAFRSD
jgi:hypothetical protein